MFSRFLGLLLILLLAACGAKPDAVENDPALVKQIKDPVLEKLALLPSPPSPIDVAVYSFTDQTGQRRASDVYADLSHAVSQGGNDILIGILLRAGHGRWFNVAERDELKAVVQERGLRKRGHGKRISKKLMSADFVLTGGIIGYDTNYFTGGIGARYLGIGGNAKYRSDLITVALRLVDVKSGRILAAVEAHESVMSYGVSGGGARFFSGRLFEADAGFTRNEVQTLATRRAIAKAVLDMIERASVQKIWALPDGEVNDLVAYLEQ